MIIWSYQDIQDTVDNLTTCLGRSVLIGDDREIEEADIGEG